jgi:hypothetical protein
VAPSAEGFSGVFAAEGEAWFSAAGGRVAEFAVGEFEGEEGVGVEDGGVVFVFEEEAGGGEDVVGCCAASGKGLVW